MSHDDDILRQALRALTTTPPRAEHPSAETLLDYHHGVLVSPETEGLRAHLARCPECAQVLLDLVGSESAEEATGADPELDAAWAQLRPKLADVKPEGPRRTPPPANDTAPQPLAADTPTQPVPQLSTPPPPPRRRPAWPLVLAASLGLVVGGLVATRWIDRTPEIHDLTAQVERLQTELAEHQRPSAGVPSRTLLPDGFLRDDTVPTLEIPTSTRQVVLALAGSDPLPGVSYRLEVTTNEGAPLWSLEPLSADSRGHFTLVVSTEALPPGEILLQLLTAEDTAPVTYRLNIAP